MIKSYLPLGQIVSTHGVRGEMRVHPWCDSPAFAKHFKTLYFGKNGEDPIKVVSAREHKNMILLTLQDVDSVEAALSLKNKMLYFRRADVRLPDNTWFIEELLECAVYDADVPDKRYGTLTDVMSTGANDVWTVTDEAGREYLLPVIPDVVIKTDVAEGRILIRPLKGIFDDAD